MSVLSSAVLLSKVGARVVILSPTRELALQTLKFTKEVWMCECECVCGVRVGVGVSEVSFSVPCYTFLQLGKFTDVRSALLLGGDSMEEQFTALHGNPDM